MPLYRILKNTAFDPELVDIMVAAYEEACQQLRLSEKRSDSITELVAKKIIEIAQTGERDPAALLQRAFKELGILASQT
jgi:hypothetical protein